MKKILSLILIIVTVFSLVSCGNKKEIADNSAPKTAGKVLSEDFKEKAKEYTDALSLSEAVSQNSIIPFETVVTEVEEGFLAGFDTEIKGFKEGATIAPMIGSIPFVGYVFILEDEADTDDFISILEQNANLRWNICVEAEEMIAESTENFVFFVMSNKDLKN